MADRVEVRVDRVALSYAARAERSKLTRFTRELLRKLREAGEIGSEEVTISLRLTDDAGMRPLNRDFRGQDRPTDVLSFPAGERDHLGDIAISVETAASRADAERWWLEDELDFLLLHGVLHLLGWDHEVPDERAAMEAREQALWTALGRAGRLRAGADGDDGDPRGNPG
jgi:probable rRNA maturation factor